MTSASVSLSDVPLKSFLVVAVLIALLVKGNLDLKLQEKGADGRRQCRYGTLRLND